MESKTPIKVEFAPCGILRPGLPLAAEPNGALVLLPGLVITEDGDTLLRSSLVYAIEEPIPRALLLSGHFLVARLDVLRARRALLLSPSEGDEELWLYLAPEAVWAVVTYAQRCPSAAQTRPFPQSGGH